MADGQKEFSMEDEEGGDGEAKPFYKSTLFLVIAGILAVVIVGAIIGVVLYFTVFKPAGETGGTGGTEAPSDNSDGTVTPSDNSDSTAVPSENTNSTGVPSDNTDGTEAISTAGTGDPTDGSSTTADPSAIARDDVRLLGQLAEGDIVPPA